MTDRMNDSENIAAVCDGYDSVEALVVNTNESSKDWILNSGCSFHMSPNKSWFESLELKDGGVVLLGNNKYCRVLGVGKIKIQLHDGSKIMLSEVRYIPELRRNLISLGMLETNGCWFKSENGLLKVLNGYRVLMKGTKSNGLYIFNSNTIIGSMSSITHDSDKTRLWHDRLSHVSENGLIELSKQGLLGNDKITKLELCETCIRGKSKRVKFGNDVHKTVKPF